MISLRSIFALFGLTLLFWACTDTLEEEVFSELTPATFLNTEDGIRSLLNSAYASAQYQSFDGHVAYHYLPSMTSGLTWNVGGSIEVFFTALTEFSWDSNHRYIAGLYNESFAAIRDANIVLDNIDNEDFSAEFRSLTTAEARFIRGWSYSMLYNNFGPVTLYTNSSTDSLLIPRSSEAEMQAFIENELTFAADNLPVTPEQYGRASKGAALAVLCKYYLNTRQWQAVVDVSQQIMDLGIYGLVDDYRSVFALANEGNEEMLWVLPRTAPVAGQNINALSFPTDYPLPYPGSSVFAARTYFFDEFVDSFEDTDTRKDILVTEYTNTSGVHVQLYGFDQSLSLKYEFDPASAGATTGNDIPAIRYADIVLARAEALNELNGPTQASIDLINEVRNRAHASSLSLGGFSKESLREAILKERKWEFFMEGKEREDQVRQGVFISMAQERGKPAQPHHVLFPIPLVDIQANPAIQQNQGY